MKLKIIDSHIHFYDNQVNQHTFLDEVDPNFMAFVGDYSTLPRQYLLKDYLQDAQPYEVAGVVWHEFLSTDPVKEVQWAQNLAKQADVRQAMVALVDFLDPELEEKLEIYSTLPNVTAVREHMVWDDRDPRKRFAKSPDLLLDPTWQYRLNILNRYDFKCGLEVFSHQLSDLVKVIERYPNIGFTIALMGWPLNVSEIGYLAWRDDIKKLSRYENLCVEISAIECIFGMKWTLDQVRPWILTTIEIFGTERCMFGSHMPIAKLARSFADIYDTYESIVYNFSDTEKENLFYRVAADWFKV